MYNKLSNIKQTLTLTLTLPLTPVFNYHRQEEDNLSKCSKRKVEDKV